MAEVFDLYLSIVEATLPSVVLLDRHLELSRGILNPDFSFVLLRYLLNARVLEAVSRGNQFLHRFPVIIRSHVDHDFLHSSVIEKDPHSFIRALL